MINPDKKTDHFIVIVGMGTDANGKYFGFFDSGTDNLWNGTSTLNRLYFNSTIGLIEGATRVNYPISPSSVPYRYPQNNPNLDQAGKVKFTVTHVRRSK